MHRTYFENQNLLENQCENGNLNENENQVENGNRKIVLTTEKILYFIFLIFFFTNMMNLYNNNKLKISTIITFSKNGRNYVINMKNILYSKITHYAKYIKGLIMRKSLPISENKIVVKPEIKYEEKYLQELRNMPKEYIFTHEELELIEKKIVEYTKEAETELEKNKRIINNEIVNHLKILKTIEEFEYDDCSEECVEIVELKLEENEMKQGVKMLQIKLDEFNLTKIDSKEIKTRATNFVIKERLDKLKNNFIIEKTPLGNVIMIYNNARTTFDYYSDSNIPYRFLETIGRRYVITYNCRPIYVDMEEELKLYELKFKEKEEKEKQEKEKQEKEKELKREYKNEGKNEGKNEDNKKKNVFAKFKSYNREAGSGKVNTAAPPKNSITNINVNINDDKKNNKIILKENANRYTCEGRFSNFNILQKVDRKKIDKKYATTFADFKKMQLEKNKN
jgi:hypothetical protein